MDEAVLSPHSGQGRHRKGILSTKKRTQTHRRTEKRLQINRGVRAEENQVGEEVKPFQEGTYAYPEFQILVIGKRFFSGRGRVG